jgi:hypothetical protein
VEGREEIKLPVHTVRVPPPFRTVDHYARFAFQEILYPRILEAAGYGQILSLLRAGLALYIVATLSAQSPKGV